MMLRIWFAVFTWLVLIASASAQQEVIINYRSGTTTTTEVSSSNPLPTSAAPSSVGGLTPVTSAALVANQIIKASAGNLYSLDVSADSTLSAAAWWIMLYDATSAPVDGAVTPLKCYSFPSGTTMVGIAFPTPIAFTTGLVAGVSTNGCFTKAASTHAFISGDAK